MNAIVLALRETPPLNLAIGAALGLVLLALPFAIYPIFAMQLLIFGLFATAFNLLIGFGGLVSFGHAAFFGGAAYVSAHAAKVWGLPVELAVILATLFAAALGALMGAIAIRRQGIYFAMSTLALAQMIYFVFLQAPFTGGEDGIQAVPRGHVLGLISLESDVAMYYTVLALFLAGFWLVWRTIHSPFGQVLKAIRDDEQRAVSLGYRVERYKLLAFTLSAALAGLAGAIKPIVFQLATLTDVQWTMSGSVILMTLLGGLGTVFGPLVGAAFVVTLEHYLAGSAFPVQVALGAIFVLCVLVFRRGIVGEARAFITGKGRD